MPVCNAIVLYVNLCNELDNAAGLLDLALGLCREEAGANDEWDLWNAPLAEHFGVAKIEEVEDGGGVGFLVCKVLLALLSWDE
jgi:hypothetical protein